MQLVWLWRGDGGSVVRAFFSRVQPARACLPRQPLSVFDPASPATATHTLHPQVTAIFGSSVEVMLSLWGETPDIGTMFHCGDAYATVVSGGCILLLLLSGRLLR